jgi:hypothetical protein
MARENHSGEVAGENVAGSRSPAVEAIGADGRATTVFST